MSSCLDGLISGALQSLREKRENRARQLTARLEQLERRPQVPARDEVRVRHQAVAPIHIHMPAWPDLVARPDWPAMAERLLIQNDVRHAPGWARGGMVRAVGDGTVRRRQSEQYGVKGLNGMYSAEIERSDVFGGGGFTLRALRREGGIGGQLAEMKWAQLEDGDMPSYALTSADAGGDMAGFLQAIMDASWRAGIRPTSYSVEDVSSGKLIEAQKAHIDSLQRQVNMQHQHIDKLLSR